MARSVKVRIAGQDLAIRTTAGPRYVEELANLVNSRVDDAKRSGRVINTQSLALLAALNIADELLQLRAEQRDLKRQVKDKSERILRTLEQALAEAPAAKKRRSARAKRVTESQ